MLSAFYNQRDRVNGKATEWRDAANELRSSLSRRTNSCPAASRIASSQTHYTAARAVCTRTSCAMSCGSTNRDTAYTCTLDLRARKDLASCLGRIDECVFLAISPSPPRPLGDGATSAAYPFRPMYVVVCEQQFELIAQ